jgi:hypothetical protein
MVNLFGPGAFGAARPAAVRPVYTPLNAPGDQDDYWQDCSSPAARDGTEWRAPVLNYIVANLRGVVRKSGVAASNLDDNLLLRAVRSQGSNFVPAVGGTANAITLAFDPAISAYSELPATLVTFVAAGNNSGNVTLNINGVGGIALRYSNGRELTPGEIWTGRFVACLVLGGGSPGATVAYLLNPAQLVVGATTSITSSATFTVPDGVTLLRKVRVWGAGGGGGGANATTSAGSGGGAGAYAEFALPVTPGQTIACTIGTGGNAGGNVSNGLAGGTTSFGSFCSCTGGGGGTGSSSGAVGGAGTGGTATLTGVTGFKPPTSGTGIGYPVGASLYAGGTGGAAYTTPLNQPSVGGAGAQGQFPGNGGNGAAAAAAGGGGGNGLILLEY